jgi:DNA-binding NarL/FixJ family response regulator
VKVIIAEDVALLREGVARLLIDAGHEVLATVADADALRATVPVHPEVDLVITDVRMPPDNTDDGLRAAVDLRRGRPDLPVMVLSAFVAGPYVRTLLEDQAPAGVGYLLKERIGRVDDFLAALEVVRGGGIVIDPLVIAPLMQVRRTSGGLGQLTPREAEVLERMARGESNTDIARGLFLSMAAVNKHVANIFTKLDLQPGQDNRRVRAVLAWLEATRSRDAFPG